MIIYTVGLHIFGLWIFYCGGVRPEVPLNKPCSIFLWRNQIGPVQGWLAKFSAFTSRYVPLFFFFEIIVDVLNTQIKSLINEAKLQVSAVLTYVVLLASFNNYVSFVAKLVLCFNIGEMKHTSYMWSGSLKQTSYLPTAVGGLEVKTTVGWFKMPWINWGIIHTVLFSWSCNSPSYNVIVISSQCTALLV